MRRRGRIIRACVAVDLHSAASRCELILVYLNHAVFRTRLEEPTAGRVAMPPVTIHRPWCRRPLFVMASVHSLMFLPKTSSTQGMYHKACITSHAAHIAKAHRHIRFISDPIQLHQPQRPRQLLEPTRTPHPQVVPIHSRSITICPSPTITHMQAHTTLTSPESVQDALQSTAPPSSNHTNTVMSAWSNLNSAEPKASSHE